MQTCSSVTGSPRQFRTISLDISGSATVNNGYGYLQSADSFYQPPTGPSSINLNQYYNDSLHSINIVPTVSYTEPLSKHSILQLNYSHNYSHSRTVNNTYDFDDSLQKYSKFDNLFSNSYTFTSNADNASLDWRLQEEKYNLSLGSGIQWMTFTSDNTTKDITVSRPYTNFTPTVNFMYNFSTTQHFRLNYSGRTGTPSAAQLQPDHDDFGQYQLPAGQSEPEAAVHPIHPDVIRLLRSVHQKGIFCDGECQHASTTTSSRFSIPARMAVRSARTRI